MKSRVFLPLLTASQVLLFVSCSAPVVQELARPLVATPVLDALLSPNKLSKQTRDYLEERDLYGIYRRDPEQVIRTLWSEPGGGISQGHRVALVELCANAGDRAGAKTGAKNGGKAVGYHLAAAELSYAGALDGALRSEAASEKLLVAYNHSAGRVAKLLFDSGHSWDTSVSFNGPGRTYRLSSRTRGRGMVDPRFFDDIDAAEYLKFKKIDLERKVRHGVGAAMVGHRNGTEERRKKNPFLPAVGMTLPVNATLEFSRGGGEVELALYDLESKNRQSWQGARGPTPPMISRPAFA